MTQHAGTTSLTPEQRRNMFEQFLRCLDREENLIHYRLTWGLQWNAACFTALVLLHNVPIILPMYKAMIEMVVALFCCLVSCFSYVAVDAAHKQTEYLIERITDRLDVVNHDWDDTEFIRPYGDKKVHKIARTTSSYVSLAPIAISLLIFVYAAKTL